MSQEPHDLVASYALDALEEDERASFERHLAECERCSAQLAELQGSVGALAYAAEGPSPPAALRGKILDAARADDGRAAIVICGLGSAPSEKTYEAWVIRGTMPQPAGLFRGGSHCAPVLLTRSVSSGSTVAVTLERAGGVTKPTGRILFHAARA